MCWGSQHVRVVNPKSSTTGQNNSTSVHSSGDRFWRSEPDRVADGLILTCRPGAGLLVERSSSDIVSTWWMSWEPEHPQRVPMGALRGPTIPLRRLRGRVGPSGIAVLGLRGLGIGQLRQRYRLHGRFFCALRQVLGVLGGESSPIHPNLAPIGPLYPRTTSFSDAYSLHLGVIQAIWRL